MRYLTALFALCCHAGYAQTPEPALSLTILLRGTGAPPRVLQALEEAADAAFAPSGLKLLWTNDLPPSGVEGQLAVVRLEGECNGLWPVLKPLATEAGVLAQTHTADGKVLPFTEVFCDAVRRFVQPGLKAAPARDRDALLGRALGRVTAYELYHILLRTTDHAASGLSRAEQASPELLAPQGSFSSGDEQRLADLVNSDSDRSGTTGR
jgi:hypothetical protein